MRALIQRVNGASVKVDGEYTGKIGTGFLVLFGVKVGDDRAMADLLAKKLAGLRIFKDNEGRINRSLNDVGGGVLIVPQFTLYANCVHGNRPDFLNSEKPDLANEMYEYFVSKVREYVPDVQTGIFGADMKVELLNDGPFTVLLDSEELTSRGSKK